jgi:cytochrome P450
MSDSMTFTGDLSFLNAVTNKDPFPAYAQLLREQPIHYDPAVGFYVVSRYEDIRRILMDPKTYSSAAWQETSRSRVESEHSKRMTDRFAANGWVPLPNVGNLDDPRHREIRSIFEKAFRPARVKDMEDEIRLTAASLVDAFAADGHCELVNAFSIPFPLLVICRQVGARQEDMWRIKHWMDALIDRVSFLQSVEEQVNSVDQVIEAQHYFKTVIDDLRGDGNGTVLSDLVNTPLSDGQLMSDEEVLSNIMDSIFLAGTETTTNSISAGVRILCEQPELFDRLKSDPANYLRIFIEEVLRLESPAQGLYRVVTDEVEMHGVKLPAGSVLHLRIGAANRDERKFACPARVELERKNAGAHLAFGSGLHHCVGAPLARRELYWAFATLVDRFKGVRFGAEQGPIEYLPNYMFRSICKLHVEFLT